MQHAVFVVPGRLDARTGGSLYNHRMVSALRARGWAIDVCELNGHFPAPTSHDVGDAARALDQVPAGSIVVVDGMAFAALPELMLEQRMRVRLVPVVHMPLADEAGLDDSTRVARRAAEARALRAASCIVVTGRSTIEALAGYGIAPDRIVLVPPGTEPAPLASGLREDIPNLLCVAALTLGKGHGILLQALAANRQHPWRLTCAGSTTRSASVARETMALAASLHLMDRVTFTGELEQPALDRELARADVFVLATLRETFGMAVAEALARGIPVVSTATGEIPSLVGLEGGIVVPPGDCESFAAALGRVLTDRSFRSGRHAGAIAARSRLVSWDTAAGWMADTLERVAGLQPEVESRGAGG